MRIVFSGGEQGGRGYIEKNPEVVFRISDDADRPVNPAENIAADILFSPPYAEQSAEQMNIDPEL